MSSVDEERTALIAAPRELWDETLIRRYPEKAYKLMLALAAALESVSPRLVTSAEEASSLPLTTVLRDDQGDIWERYVESGGKNAWRTTGHGDPFSSNWIVFPATVLWSPAPEGSPE